MTRARRLAPHAGALAGSCLVGAAVVATRVAVEDIDPIGLAFLRYVQGAFLLFAVVLLTGSSPLAITRRDIRSFALLGILMFALFPVLFNTSLRYTSASRGAIILATMPLWSALLARRFRGERLRSMQIAGVLCSFAGVLVVFAESALEPSGGTSAIVGNLLMLATALVGGLHAVLAKPIMSLHKPLLVTAWSMLAGAALLAIPAVLDGVPGQVTDASTKTLMLVLYLGSLGGAIAFWLFAETLKRLGPTQALVYVNINPVVATLLASVFLDDMLSPTFGLGFLLVIAGLLMTNLRRHVNPFSRAGAR
ncbi:MAG: DMT family transporter [Thermomicrobiales bacterium]